MARLLRQQVLLVTACRLRACQSLTGRNPAGGVQLRHHVIYAQVQQQREQKLRQAAPAPQLLRSRSSRSNLPGSLEELMPAVAANLPVFHLHPAERFFPCTVEWFLERSEVLLLRKGWRRRQLKVLQQRGSVTGPALAALQREFEGDPDARHRIMQLRLDAAAQEGQHDAVQEVPIYVHVKELVSPEGQREALEFNYCCFNAFNGWYKLFDRIYLGKIGAHDADWEHVTLRMSPDAVKVLGMYYSAHRHRDGVWRSADELPRGPDGRPLSYVALNGHGHYPVAGFIPRNLLAFNDRTSDQGLRWDPKRCVMITNGRLPRVLSRGSSLNGSSYESGHITGQSGADVDITQEPAEWLQYHGRWGSTVEAPAVQRWFAEAEHPVSRTWLQQVFLPLAPGVESIWEPLQEEFEERGEQLREAVEEAVDDAGDNVQHMRQRVKELSKDADKQMRQRLESIIKQQRDKDRSGKT